MRSVVLLTTGLIAVAAAAAKLYQSRRDLSPTVVALCCSIIGIGSSAALVAPSSLEWISHWEPFPNAGRLVANLLAMLGSVATAGLLAFLVHDPPRARRILRIQVGVFLVAAAAMTVLMLRAGVPFTTRFVADYAGVPAVAAYGAIMSAQIGSIELMLGWFLHRYITRTRRPWLRAGLRTVQVSTVFGVGWAVSKVVASVVAVSGGDPQVWDPIAGVLSGVCVMVMGLGSTMPFWGPFGALPVLWWRAAWQLRRLRPLWALLVDALPQIQLPAQLMAGNARFVLYRRVVEIRDGQLVLRPYVHPDLHTWAEQSTRAAGLDAASAQRVAEAAALLAGLDAHAAGHRWRDDDVSDTPFRDIAAEPSAEAAWLIAVSRYLGHPLVAELRTRAAAALSSGEEETSR